MGIFQCDQPSMHTQHWHLLRLALSSFRHGWHIPQVLLALVPSMPPHDVVCWLCFVLWLLVLLSNVPLHLAYCVGMFVASIIEPRIPLYKTYSYSMLVLGCYVDRWHDWALLPRARGTFIWAPMLSSALERCSLCAWHIVFAWGVARALRAWSGAPSALAALIQYILFEHWSWVLLSPMCLCAWPIQLVCWLCLVRWLLVLLGPTCLCTWPVNWHVGYERYLGHWQYWAQSTFLQDPFIRHLSFGCYVDRWHYWAFFVSDCCHVLVEPSFGIPSCPRRWSGAPSVLGAVLPRHWPHLYSMSYLNIGPGCY